VGGSIEIPHPEITKTDFHRYKLVQQEDVINGVIKYSVRKER